MIIPIILIIVWASLCIPFTIWYISTSTQETTGAKPKKKKSKTENINENIYTTIPDIVADLEQIIDDTILWHTDGNGLIHINTQYNVIFRLEKEPIFRENDIRAFIRFLRDLLQKRREEDELANTRHLNLIINKIENTVANEGHTIGSIEMERELLSMFRKKHQINEYIDPLGKAIVLSELKKYNSEYRINYKDKRIDEAVTGN